MKRKWGWATVLCFLFGLLAGNDSFSLENAPSGRSPSQPSMQRSLDNKSPVTVRPDGKVSTAPASKQLTDTPGKKLEPVSLSIRKRGDVVWLEINREVDDLTVFSGSERLRRFPRAVSFDITEAVQTSKGGTLRFEWLDADGRRKTKTLSTAAYYRPTPSSATTVGVGKKTREAAKPFLTVRGIELKRGTVHIELDNTSGGQLSEEDYNNEIVLRIGPKSTSWRLKQVDPSAQLNKGRMVMFDTGVRLEEKSIVSVSLPHLPGQKMKTASLAPEKSLIAQSGSGRDMKHQSSQATAGAVSPQSLPLGSKLIKADKVSAMVGGAVAQHVTDSEPSTVSGEVSKRAAAEQISSSVPDEFVIKPEIKISMLTHPISSRYKISDGILSLIIKTELPGPFHIDVMSEDGQQKITRLATVSTNMLYPTQNGDWRYNMEDGIALAAESSVLQTPGWYRIKVTAVPGFLTVSEPESQNHLQPGLISENVKVGNELPASLGNVSPQPLEDAGAQPPPAPGGVTVGAENGGSGSVAHAIGGDRIALPAASDMTEPIYLFQEQVLVTDRIWPSRYQNRWSRRRIDTDDDYQSPFYGNGCRAGYEEHWEISTDIFRTFSEWHAFIYRCQAVFAVDQYRDLVLSNRYHSVELVIYEDHRYSQYLGPENGGRWVYALTGPWDGPCLSTPGYVIGEIPRQGNTFKMLFTLADGPNTWTIMHIFDGWATGDQPNHGIVIGSYLEEFVQHALQDDDSHWQHNYSVYQVHLEVSYYKDI